MTKQEILRYLRLNLTVQNPDTLEDSEYLKMSDDDLQLYVNVAISKDFPQYTIDTLPNSMLYIVVLTVKKELFHALAVKEAPVYDLSADGGGKLSKSQRFNHYYALIQQIDLEITEYENSGGTNNTLTSYDVLLENRDGTRRNYELGVIPTVNVYLTSVTLNSVSLAWNISNVSRLATTEVYLSTSKIYDEYDRSISKEAVLVKTFNSLKATSIKISGLTEGVEYHFLILVTAMNGNKALYEITAIPNVQVVEEVIV